MSTNNTPIRTAIAATPKATTEVKSDDWRKAEFMATSRNGSSRSSSV
jgi:hypothetical protein